MKLKRNVPGWERGIRVVLGAALAVGGGIWAFAGGLVLGLLLAASGLGLAATGLSGWCPMCAAVGRTLPEATRTIPVARL